MNVIISLWMLQTEISHLWKVRYAIILLGWRYAILNKVWFLTANLPGQTCYHINMINHTIRDRMDIEHELIITFDDKQYWKIKSKWNWSIRMCMTIFNLMWNVSCCLDNQTCQCLPTPTHSHKQRQYHGSFFSSLPTPTKMVHA